MKTHNKQLNDYYDACNLIKIAFIEEYFCDEDITLNDVDAYWIADKPGEVCFINDYFWNMEDFVTALDFQIPKTVLFKWYDYSLEEHEKGKCPINLFTYSRMKV